MLYGFFGNSSVQMFQGYVATILLYGVNFYVRRRNYVNKFWVLAVEGHPRKRSFACRLLGWHILVGPGVSGAYDKVNRLPASYLRRRYSRVLFDAKSHRSFQAFRY